MDSPLLLLRPDNRREPSSRPFFFTGFTRNSFSRSPASTPNVRSMEKPEWFETVEASESAPRPINNSSARAHRVRLTQGFALLAIASVIAVGGLGFVQSANAPSSLSASAAPVATASAPASTNTPAATTATAAANATQAIGLAGGRPTITSAVGGEGND